MFSIFRNCLWVGLLKLYMILIFCNNFLGIFCEFWLFFEVLEIFDLVLLLEVWVSVLLLWFFILVINCFIGLLGVVCMMIKFSSMILIRVGMISVSF